MPRGKGPPYTSEEDEFLRQNYRQLGAGHCAKVLCRPYKSIRNRAVKLQLHKAHKVEPSEPETAARIADLIELLEQFRSVDPNSEYVMEAQRRLESLRS